jgi:hypothetical protein
MEKPDDDFGSPAGFPAVFRLPPPGSVMRPRQHQYTTPRCSVAQPEHTSGANLCSAGVRSMQ